MRRLLALIVLGAALLGGSPVFACVTGAAGDCCPTTCCLTGSTQSPAVSAERIREQQPLQLECGRVDPVAIVTALVSLPHEIRQSSGFDAASNRAAAPDRSLTYLQTGRLRL